MKFVGITEKLEVQSPFARVSVFVGDRGITTRI